MKNKKEDINTTTVDDLYTKMIIQSGLISYAPVKGTMFFKPYGWKIWKLIQQNLNEELDKLNVEEVQFPLLMPKSLLEKEKENFQGFSPEVLTITKVGDRKLNEEYIIRPTSEALFGVYFKENISSYRELPLKLNQWVNVIRWENNTRPFLRNSEFHWQEGHTCHSESDEAKEFTTKILHIYQKLIKQTLLIPTIVGKKTENEKFAGAIETYTVETILQNGMALQLATSHFLGQNFSKAFNVNVLGKDNKMFKPYQSSWGTSTRLIGGIIMTHSDDKGLILPSKIAPYELVIIPILFGKDLTKDQEILDMAKKISKRLKVRIHIDDSNKGFGFKSKEWEMKGAPLRIEIGPKGIVENQITFVRRNSDEKKVLKIDKVTQSFIEDELAKFDKSLEMRSSQRMEQQDTFVTSIKEISSRVKHNKNTYQRAYWKEDIKLEKEIKEKYSITIRCIVKVDKSEKAINSDEKVNTVAYFARAY